MIFAQTGYAIYRKKNRHRTGLCDVGEFKKRPEPLLIKDIEVKVNKQKPSDICPQMKHNSDY